ncbi:hypothetical protein CI109_107103 [Kwoniella shandongensis]|uniref:Uncharacterized protein n=1 Tax=Kwoniella shandongensis TaxID=1734106 RepID=A0A5M6C6F8_9TREE|nr:uncharacterized protein CI109_002386 [Kwoniella shandongensis]KAA5529045.1 hypothetical protein CI109_002386 [Kwoniella shandongensis]
MATPPSNLPSPTPSSSSHSHYQSLSIPPNGPPRVSSAASGVSHSSASGREGNPARMYGENQQYNEYQQTPGPYSQNVSPAFLPPLTSSPPPHPPPYVPPPQHAMAPDPIHSLPPGGGGQGMLGMNQQLQMGPGGMLPGPWPNGPPGPNGWRGNPGQGGIGFNGQPPLPYGRAGLPNGHQLPPNPIEAYGPGSRSSFSSQGLGPRPGSALGESRERRRDRRDRDDDRGEDEEVISTIFVVGFPDDMAEREFQNIFTFSPGFEAATLKFPSGSARREPAATLLAELTQLAAYQSAQAAAGEHVEFPIGQQGLEEAMAAMSMAATASTSASTTPSAAISLTPSAPSGPMLGNPPLPTRRQTIGFARFKTRADALAAKEHLQGRKIDTLTGATLKAEMAKKNLHTKRATSGEELMGLLLRSGRLAGLVNAAGQIGGTAPTVNGIGNPNLPPGVQSGSAQQSPPTAREAWDAWPSSTLSERERQSLEDSKAMPPPSNPPPVNPVQTQTTNQGSTTSSTSTLSHPPNSQQQQQSFASSASKYAPTQPNTGPSNNISSSQSNASNSPSLSVKSPAQRPTDSKALLALAEEADELEGWSVNGAVGMGIMDGLNHNQPPRRGPAGPGQQGLGNAPGYGGALGLGGGGGFAVGRGAGGGPVHEVYGTSPPGGSDLSDSGRGLLSGSNPADQNPPINTLYVGNLPAISPPTHPPNFLEESLRSLFSRCAGFKRMSFRQKINGPMCFVEFEEVPYASQAIKDLYGHNLGGLVKGGIRLSYSKNSLGQRGNAHPSALNTSMFGGIAHTVALAGMSMTSPSAQAAHPLPGGAGPNANNGLSLNTNMNGNGLGGHGPLSAGPNPAYGLQLQGGPSREPTSAPIPDLRRDMNGNSLQPQGQAQGTSLSPTAQPFNVSLPNPTSPRSRYFSQPPSNSSGIKPSSADNGPSPLSPIGGVPIPTPSSSSSGASAFQPFGGQTSVGSNSATSQFSPVSSPIRTPFSWVSSSAGTGGRGIGGMGQMGSGNGYGFDFGGNGGGVPLGSLNGAASAWGEKRE